MKKILSVVLAVSMLICIFITPMSHALDGVTLSVDSVNGNRGDTVKVSVKISKSSNIQALGLNLEYDQSVLEVVSAKKGVALGNVSPAINSSTLGKIVFSYASSGVALTSSGSIMDVEFKIKSNATYGKSLIKLNVTEASDGNFDAIEVTSSDGNVTVNAPALDAPEGLTIDTCYSNAVTVSWDYNDMATGYNVYLNGLRVNDEIVEEPFYTITDLEPLTEYSIQVSAVNYTVESDKSDIIIAKTLANRYRISFYTEENVLIDEIEVDEGGHIVPPDAPEKDGYTFAGWALMAFDETRGQIVSDFSDIKTNMSLSARYNKINLTVKFVDWDDTVIDTQVVEYGQSATEPETPTREGYVFQNWDTPFNEIIEDTTIKAIYAEATCEHKNTSIVNATSSTCTVAGSDGNLVCNDCGKVLAIGNSRPLASHQYVDTVVNATEESQGYTLHTCKVCGHSYKDTYIDYVDESQPQITVITQNGILGSTIEVPVVLKNNPGMVSLSMDVLYDESVLKLIKVTDGGILGEQQHTSQLSSPYRLTWANDTISENILTNGTLVTLSFEILSEAKEGQYPITISYNYDNSDAYDKDMQKVKLHMISGYVNVNNYMIGDVNGDGVVNNIDRAILSRYLAKWPGYTEESIVLLAADVNQDGTVNNVDRAILSRYLAKWPGYESLPYKAS